MPKRGIGDRAEAAWPSWRPGADHFWEALRRADEIPGLATRSANQLHGASPWSDEHQAMVADGQRADVILTSVLDRSGYLARAARLDGPAGRDPAGEPAELVAVAREFVSGVAAADACRTTRRWTSSGVLDDSDATARTAIWPPRSTRGRPRGRGAPSRSLAGAFLERVALVADSDQIPDARTRRTPAWSP